MSSSSGGCQRLRVLLLDLVLLLLLPTIDAFRGPMSATKSNIFERKASTDSAGAESLASASESTSSSLDLRDHHRFYIIRHGETDANAADGGCLGWIMILMLGFLQFPSHPLFLTYSMIQFIRLRIVDNGSDTGILRRK